MINNIDKGYKVLGKEGVLAAISGTDIVFSQTGYRYLCPDSDSLIYPISSNNDTEFIFFTKEDENTVKFLINLGFTSGEYSTVFFNKFTQYLNPMSVYRFENSITVVVLSERDVCKFSRIQELLKKQFKRIFDDKKKYTVPKPQPDESLKSAIVGMFYMELVGNIITMYELINLVQGKEASNEDGYW
jgi:hypothetical protein